VTREIGDLHLPVARVHERPGGKQEHGVGALPVHLVEEALAVALDEALGVGIARARLLARAQRGSAPDDARRLGWARRLHAGGVGGAHRPVSKLIAPPSKTSSKGVWAARRKRVEPPAAGSPMSCGQSNVVTK